MQDGLTATEWAVYEALYKYSGIQKDRRTVSVGVALLKRKTLRSYSTIQRAINALQAKGVLVMLEREQPWIGAPRTFLIKSFKAILDFWRSLGGLFVHRNRGVQIVKATGEPVEMKRPALPELVRKIIAKVHALLGKPQNSVAPQAPDLETIQADIRKADELDRQKREADLLAKQEKTARRAAITKRLDELWVQIKRTAAGSPEGAALNQEAIELSKEFRS